MAVETGTKADELPDRGLAVVTDDGPESEDRMKAIRDRFTVHQTFWSQIHAEGLEDDKFIAGEHWAEDVRKQREEDRRPVLTYNLLPSFTRQITNKVRQDRPQIKVIPVESNRGPNPQVANVSGTKDYALADVYSGIIKNIEHVSRASQAYDTALKHGVDHGFGFFYLMNEWSRVDPFVQELVIHRVKNSYTVTLDPEAQEADYRDAQDAFMSVNMKKATFLQKWPDADFTEFANTAMGASYDGWYDPDQIRVVQYYWISYEDDEVVQLNNGKTIYWSVLKDVFDELHAQAGIYIAKDAAGKEMRKDVKRPVCNWQKMTAKDILEGPLELPFSAIPIFPVLGEEVMVDGRIRYESAIRHAKDPQRSYNYWRTAATEAVALAPRAPWLLTERQVAGHEQLYESANTRNHPYLVYNHEQGVSPPARQQPAQVAAAELQNAIQDGQDMQTIIGLHDASLGRESNEKSGKAILARQSQGTTSTFQFPDNLARAQEQMGRLIVEAIPKIYDTNRIMRIRLPDDTDDFVELNQSVVDEESGDIHLVHDIAYGKYDVVMDTGPSYATQRQEAADLQMELLKVLGPDKAGNIVHLIVKNLGVPGSEEVARVLRKMLPDQLKSEDEKMADLPKGVTQGEDGQLMKDGEPWQPPPTLDQQIMQKQQEIDELSHKASLAESEAKMAGAEADKKEAEADIAEAQADLAKAQKEMAELQTQTPEDPDNSALLAEIEKIIQQAMAEHEGDPDAHRTATAEQVAEAVVESLRRTKAYVDRTTKQAAASTAADTPKPKDNGSGAKPAPPVQIFVGKPPERIKFTHGPEGIETAEAEYSEEK